MPGARARLLTLQWRALRSPAPATRVIRAASHGVRAAFPGHSLPSAFSPLTFSCSRSGADPCGSLPRSTHPTPRVPSSRALHFPRAAPRSHPRGAWKTTLSRRRSPRATSSRSRQPADAHGATFRAFPEGRDQQFQNIGFVDLNLDRNDYYRIDDHLTSAGHDKAARRLFSLIRQDHP